MKLRYVVASLCAILLTACAVPTSVDKFGPEARVQMRDAVTQGVTAAQPLVVAQVPALAHKPSTAAARRTAKRQVLVDGVLAKNYTVPGHTPRNVCKQGEFGTPADDLRGLNYSPKVIEAFLVAIEQKRFTEIKLKPGDLFRAMTYGCIQKGTGLPKIWKGPIVADWETGEEPAKRYEVVVDGVKHVSINMDKCNNWTNDLIPQEKVAPAPAPVRQAPPKVQCLAGCTS